MIKYLRNTKKVGDCMVWQGAKTPDGYPRAMVRGNSNARLHREVFRLHNGYTPDVVRHTCDNPLCINPDHLIDGSVQDNIDDRNRRGRTHNHVSSDHIEAITYLRGKGMTYNQIAQELGIKAKRVEYVITRKS